jgi:hypothetical protein
VLLGYVVLALALFGLAAVIAEAWIKNPEALLDMTKGAEEFARPVRHAARSDLAGIPANDSAPRRAA